MTRAEAIRMIETALVAATNRSDREVSEDSHLLSDGLLDSLDASVFLLEVERMSGRKITDREIEEQNLFKVSNLADWLCR